MKSRERQLIVVTASQDPGFNESTFPLLNEVFEAARPDHLNRLFCAFTSYFRPDGNVLIRIEGLIERLDAMKQGIPALGDLRIGVSIGPVLAESSWTGRIKRVIFGGPPVQDAFAGDKIPGLYRTKLQQLKENLQPDSRRV